MTDDVLGLGEGRLTNEIGSPMGNTGLNRWQELLFAAPADTLSTKSVV